MIDVRMCDDDGDHFEPVLVKDVGDLVDFIAGINNNGFACSFISKDGAVALEQADGQGYLNHVLLIYPTLRTAWYFSGNREGRKSRLSQRCFVVPRASILSVSAARMQYENSTMRALAVTISVSTTISWS